MEQGKLFEIKSDKHQNLLPYEGEVFYYGQILKPISAHKYLSTLLYTIAWKRDEFFMFGKKTTTKRKVAWYGDRGLVYTYSNASKKALPWTKELLELKSIVEDKTKEIFNSCLLNLYHDGSEGMGWHSDDEKELKKEGAIASLSLGADRKFDFRHKSSKENVGLILEHGSLLVMKGKTQKYWQHRLAKSQKVKSPRINLTFRRIES